MVHVIIWPKKIMYHISDITTKHAVMLPGHSGAGNARYIHVELHRETNQSWVEAEVEAKHCLQIIAMVHWLIISMLELPTHQVTDTFLKCIMTPAF